MKKTLIIRTDYLYVDFEYTFDGNVLSTTNKTRYINQPTYKWYITNSGTTIYSATTEDITDYIFTDYYDTFDIVLEATMNGIVKTKTITSTTPVTVNMTLQYYNYDINGIISRWVDYDGTKMIKYRHAGDVAHCKIRLKYPLDSITYQFWFAINRISDNTPNYGFHTINNNELDLYNDFYNTGGLVYDTNTDHGTDSYKFTKYTYNSYDYDCTVRASSGEISVSLADNPEDVDVTDDFTSLIITDINGTYVDKMLYNEKGKKFHLSQGTYTFTINTELTDNNDETWHRYARRLFYHLDLGTHEEFDYIGIFTISLTEASGTVLNGELYTQTQLGSETTQFSVEIS